MGKPKVTYEDVRALFDYDPETGVVTRRQTTSSRARRGMIVGCKNTQGYLVVNIDRTVYYLHRIIWLWMTGEWPEYSIDHINRKQDDNRWSNLRSVSYSVNCHNRSVASGVYWANRDNVWVATITLDGKKKHIGQHKDRTVAEAMYVAEKNKHRPVGDYDNHL